MPDHFDLRRICDMQRNGYLRERSDVSRHHNLTGIPYMRRVNHLLRRRRAHLRRIANLHALPDLRGFLHLQNDNMRSIRDLQWEHDLQLVQHLPVLADLCGPDDVRLRNVPGRSNLSRGYDLRPELHMRR